MRSRSTLKLLTLLFLAALASVGFASLSVWQIERRAWKLDLIERVNTRIHAAVVPAPSPAQWPAVFAANSEYRHVRLVGHFLHDRETLVTASTERGVGYWVLTPLETVDGFVVLVNRGFVASAYKSPTTRVAGQLAGEVTLFGLMRMTEPKGGVLRSNDPKADRWYSRDVAAIAVARGLDPNLTAPYFVDADATDAPDDGRPVGGLTVVSFRNQHLQYAITWLLLALLPLMFIFITIRHEWRLRCGSPD
jgi:surfeit locus 1 family protein